ncbi:hypothetical protein CGC21_37095 [Leishmania donovani]|uniref:Uncharacterized protein n=1 Tax=Leishmania donovani TaxID=5661 RepID=A0A504Y315_LEIDO|nr:hypothetical protein CGC21_37095 [Leishmania donovani]
MDAILLRPHSAPSCGADQRPAKKPLQRIASRRLRDLPRQQGTKTAAAFVGPTPAHAAANITAPQRPKRGPHHTRRIMALPDHRPALCVRAHKNKSKIARLACPFLQLSDPNSRRKLAGAPHCKQQQLSAASTHLEEHRQPRLRVDTQPTRRIGPQAAAVVKVGKTRRAMLRAVCPHECDPSTDLLRYSMARLETALLHGAAAWSESAGWKLQEACVDLHARVAAVAVATPKNADNRALLEEADLLSTRPHTSSCAAPACVILQSPQVATLHI